ncbi:MAG TPA: YncE family protein [Methylocystis sp.]|nr:YncE family protein [Methylocystis sp.]
MNLFKRKWNGAAISTAAIGVATMLGAGGPARATVNDLYVASQNNAVYVVRTNPSGVPTKLITTLPVGTYPQVARATPDGSEVWVVNGGDATITAINTSNFSEQTFSVSSGPNSFPGYVVFNPFQNVAYVIDGGSNQVTFVDTRTKKVLPVSVTVGNTPGYAGLSGDGRTLYVSNYFDNTVSVVNVATYSQTAVIGIPNTNPPGTNNPPTNVCQYQVNPAPVVPLQLGPEFTSPPSPQGVAVQDPFVFVLNGYTSNLLPCQDTSPAYPNGGTGDVTFQESTVNVIAEWDNEIKGTVLAGGPGGTATGFSVDGNWLYATNTGNDDYPGNTFGVINPAARKGGPKKVLTLPTGWTGATEIDADPDPCDNLAYVAADGATPASALTTAPPNISGLVTVNSNSNTITSSFPLPAYPNASGNPAFAISIAVVPHWW